MRVDVGTTLLTPYATGYHVVRTNRSVPAQPVPLHITIRGVGKPSLETCRWASIVRRASSPLDARATNNLPRKKALRAAARFRSRGSSSRKTRRSVASSGSRVAPTYSRSAVLIRALVITM